MYMRHATANATAQVRHSTHKLIKTNVMYFINFNLSNNLWAGLYNCRFNTGKVIAKIAES